MPIYEYQCPKCGNVKERLVATTLDKMLIGEIVLCSQCNKFCERIMSPSNGVVKGKYTAKTGYTYAAQNKPLGEKR